MSHTRTLRVVAIVSIITVLIAGGVAAWLVVSGRIVWVDDPANQQSVVEAPLPGAREVVCGDEMVTRYNKAVTYEQRDGDSERLTPDSAALASIAAEIRALPSYADAPTCQSMLLWIGIEESNYDQTKEAYDRLVLLHERNFFPNNNLSNNEALVVYESTLEFLRNGSEAAGE